MNWKTWIPLVLAIGLGLVAAKVARDTLNKDRKPEAQTNLTPVVVTNRSLPPGSEITAADLVIGQVSTESAPEQSFNNIADLLGRTVKVELVRGQAVVEPLLAERGTGSGLQSLVPQGLRAITIEVNEFSGIANLVAPGCRVDVVATIQATGNEEMSARTVVQNVKVTAVGQRVTAKPDPRDDQAQAQVFRSVTLLCTPEEAETISLSQTTGRPWLVLRGNNDDEEVKTNGITLTGLRGKSGSAFRRNDPFTPMVEVSPISTTQPSQTRSSEPVAFNTRSIQVIRGGAESIITLQLPTMQGSDVTGTEDLNK